MSKDYGYFGKGDSGYHQYMTSFDRNFESDSGQFGKNKNLKDPHQELADRVRQRIKEIGYVDRPATWKDYLWVYSIIGFFGALFIFGILAWGGVLS